MTVLVEECKNKKHFVPSESSCLRARSFSYKLSCLRARSFTNKLLRLCARSLPTASKAFVWSLFQQTLVPSCEEFRVKI